MAQEIERKFLVKSESFKDEAIKITHYRQGYVPTVNGMTVRFRIAGEKGYITMKDHAVGFTRNEFEYEIPIEDVKQILDIMCAKPQIDKTRYVIPAITASTDSDLYWEVDVFHGDNEGLVVAEIEVPNEDTKFKIPTWLGEEVTSDHRYYNSALCKHPYKEWME